MPDSIEECNYAALKIMMNRGRNADAAIQIFLDDSPITLHHDRISPVPGWYEIHFDKKRLEKKSSIHVYIRSSAKKYMHIWGRSGYIKCLQHVSPAENGGSVG
ncbi:MAG: hypothetical protein GY801_08005 [bacterium]|nr:hypothetical protein [bacterium]